MQKLNEFDGMIVCQREGNMGTMLNDGSSIDDMFFISKKQKITQYKTLTSDEINFIRILKKINKYHEESIDTSFCETIRRNSQRLEERAIRDKKISIKEKPSELKEIICKGKLRIILLLNSHGGLVNSGFEPLSGLASSISSRAGDVITIGGKAVCSAAADSWMLGGDQGHQFCLKTSRILFHLSNLCYGEDAVEDEEDREYYTQAESSKIRDLLVKRALPAYKKNIEDKFQFANANIEKRADRPIIFTGQEAEEIGYGRSVESGKDLQEIFQEVSGLEKINAEMSMFFGGCHLAPMKLWKHLRAQLK